MTPPTNEEDRLAYGALAQAMLRDEHLDVDVTPEGFRVRGKLFAFLDGSDLVIDLPEARVTDLQSRGVAESFEVVGHVNRNWVRVRERGLWPEMAREAHRYVGHPAVGGES